MASKGNRQMLTRVAVYLRAFAHEVLTPMAECAVG
jgi:hypothetical protein